MTLAVLHTLWSPEQTLLTIGIVVCCALLMIFRPAAPPPPPTDERDQKRKKRGKGQEKHKPAPAPAAPPVEAPAPLGATARRRMLLAGRVLLVLVILGVAGFLYERSEDPIGMRSDSWSDANVVVGGRNAAKMGFFALYGASQIQPVTDANPSDPFFIYTQYPPGSTLINDALQVAGYAGDAVFRLPPAMCSLASLVVWFVFYRRFAGEPIAIVATIVMATSYGFLGYADNLHFHAYALLTSSLAMLFYVIAMEPARKRRWPWFGLAGLFMFLTAAFTWEYHFFMVLFIALYAFVFPCPVRKPWLALLALPLFVELGLQNLQRDLALGAVERVAVEGEEAGGGFLSDLYRRTLGFEVAVDTPRGITLGDYPWWLLLRYYKFYGVPALAAAVIVLMLLMLRGRAPWNVRAWPGAEKLLVVLLIAGTGWWLVMMQHTSVHRHIMRHGLPGYALLVALVWVRAWQTAWSARFPLPARIVAPLLGAILLYPQIEGLVYDYHIHSEPKYYNRRGRERGGAGLPEMWRFAPLREIVPEGGVILTNHGRLPPMRLWSRRPVYGAAFAPSPRNQRDARYQVEMAFNHLRDLYDDALPPLYYVYAVRGREPLRHPWLWFLLTGEQRPRQPAQAQLIEPATALRRGWDTGTAPTSYCPIVARSDYLLVFDMTPAIPRLRELWSDYGYPTLAEFGAPR